MAEAESPVNLLQLTSNIKMILKLLFLSEKSHIVALSRGRIKGKSLQLHYCLSGAVLRPGSALSISMLTWFNGMSIVLQVFGQN